MAEAAASAMDAAPPMEGTTYSIIEEDESAGLWRIDAFPTSEPEAAALAGHLAGYNLRVSREVLADADWLAMALSGLPPVRAGRFFVFGVHDRGRVPRGLIPLRIEAGAAFGTGHHGTTVGCLLALDRLLRRQHFTRVLDVGTGTGVLAIGAARTGSRVVVGTDIDPVSVRIARENARANRTHARFTHASALAGPLVRGCGPYDLVFANILARPLIRLSSQIVQACRPGGSVILSGLLRSQARMVLAAYLSRGMALEARIGRDAWMTLLLRRRGG